MKHYKHFNQPIDCAYAKEIPHVIMKEHQKLMLEFNNKKNVDKTSGQDYTLVWFDELNV